MGWPKGKSCYERTKLKIKRGMSKHWSDPESRKRRLAAPRKKRRPREIIQCRSCGKDIEIVKGAATQFCDTECRIESTRKPDLFCQVCGKKLHKKVSPTGKCHKCFHAEYRGEKHHQWNPNSTKLEYKRLRGTPEFKKWRADVFERDGYTCTNCGITGGKLHADHIKPFATYPLLRTELSNGRTLCEPCHQASHRTDSQIPLLHCNETIVRSLGRLRKKKNSLQQGAQIHG